PIMESVAGVDRNADLPAYAAKPLLDLAKAKPPVAEAPAKGRKAVLFATCFGNYNDPDIGMDLLKVLARNGVEVETLYPGCCGMPQLEVGDIARVAEQAKKIAATFKPYIEQGYDIVSLVPSCTLMLKFEWQLIVPDDDTIKLVSQATFDAAEYIVDIAKKEGLAEGMKPLDGGVTVHVACHARAQNVGQKAAELLRLIPDTQVQVIERCSGHGGAWGVEKGNFETAIKVGKPVARQAAKNATPYVVSECPLGRSHILQGMDMLGERPADAPALDKEAKHPVQLIARAYGL
ncbi:MAG: heterodisulfide reductase-related iron-sulfur binding cluster, partial [Rhodospirillales bacterium]